MGAIASQIPSLTIVYSTVYSDADQRKHQRAASLAFVRGIASNTENVSIWFHHDSGILKYFTDVTYLHRLAHKARFIWLWKRHHPLFRASGSHAFFWSAKFRGKLHSRWIFFGNDFLSKFFPNQGNIQCVLVTYCLREHDMLNANYTHMEAWGSFY